MVGDTKTSAVPSDHLGWLKCDGRDLSVSEYYQLWRVIGYSFGGSNDMFMLPDAQGRVPGFAGTGNDVNNSTITFTFGGTPGEYSHQLTVPELPEHSHTGATDSAGSHSHTQTTVNDDFNNTAPGPFGGYPDSNFPSYPRYDGGGSVTWQSAINSNGTHTHTFTTSNTGSNVFHNNIQPTIVIGNLFIYSGKPNTPRSGFAYTENTQIL